MNLDISSTLQANSEQVNADDLAAPVTVTITNVERGTTEQPVFIHLAEFPGRTFRPAKTVRRLLVAAWGPEASAYIGRRLTLFNDRSVKWGGQAVGGVRVSHMSHIDQPLSVHLSVSRGKRAPFTVQPLEDAPVDPAQVAAALTAITNATTTTELDKIATHATRIGIHSDIASAIESRRNELA